MASQLPTTAEQRITTLEQSMIERAANMDRLMALLQPPAPTTTSIIPPAPTPTPTSIPVPVEIPSLAPLEAKDIPTWKDPKKKFKEQYHFNADVVPTRLELQEMEMKEWDNFKKYATDWRAKEAQDSSGSSYY
ncbi:hypothetical protein CRG98_033162 [Punica granatum]|uniref:Uncharacterized protein n=1 Tax=Punica granatum TaxID=22663 RepID=A0A2I0IR39_PUNGR|nr:hypothetical protein CRG98_033162 [Punica granatum]